MKYGPEIRGRDYMSYTLLRTRSGSVGRPPAGRARVAGSNHLNNRISQTRSFIPFSDIQLVYQRSLYAREMTTIVADFL